jgi:hypothetical protein
VERRSITLATSAGAAVACAVTLAGCGGESSGESAGRASTDTAAAGSGIAGSSRPDPSVVPPPGQARIEVDGDVFTLTASGSIYHACETGADQIRINFQTADKGDLLLQARRASGEWLGNVTFASGDDNYGGTLPRTGEGLAVDESAATYRGTLVHRTYSDPSTTRDVEATVAVNCGTTGSGSKGDATAEIDGRTLVFPADGAQSYDCTVTPTTVDVRVNRLAVDDAQIEIQGTNRSGEWVGNVYVISGDDRFNATIPPDGVGLEISRTTLTFDGTFTQTSATDPSIEREVEGSASVSCP